MPTSTPELPLARPRTAPLSPPPAYARLREKAPITRVSIWKGRLTQWLVTRWEDASTLLGSPAFSNHPHPGHPSFREITTPPPRGFLLQQDEPVHGMLRNALTREFMAKRVEALRPFITANMIARSTVTRALRPDTSPARGDE
jgi:cytochrome P450